MEAQTLQRRSLTKLSADQVALWWNSPNRGATSAEAWWNSPNRSAAPAKPTEAAPASAAAQNDRLSAAVRRMVARRADRGRPEPSGDKTATQVDDPKNRLIDAIKRRLARQRGELR